MAAAPRHTAGPLRALPPAELVNASFSLIGAERLPALADLVRQIHAALTPNGCFAGQLLGPRDSWVAAGRRVVGLDRSALRPLLSGFRLVHLDEEESDTVTPKGEVKHWHLWHVVAAKYRDRVSSCWRRRACSPRP
jgi:hypothetical protein